MEHYMPKDQGGMRIQNIDIQTQMFAQQMVVKIDKQRRLMAGHT
jgi:hypothetical protein